MLIVYKQTADSCTICKQTADCRGQISGKLLKVQAKITRTLTFGGSFSKVIAESDLVSTNVFSGDLIDDQGHGLGIGIDKLVPIPGCDWLTILGPLYVGPEMVQ